MKTLVIMKRFSKIKLQNRVFSTTKIKLKASDKVPSKPTWKHADDSVLPPKTKIPVSLAKHLEQLSLVNFENTAAVVRLESAIRFADHLLLVETEGVEPMDSVLENECLFLRDDKAEKTEENIVKLAKERFESYYIAPEGNIEYVAEDIPDDTVAKK